MKQTITMSQWFTFNPADGKGKKEGLNKKYGQYDYASDARILYEDNLRKLIACTLGDQKKLTVVIVGANDGREASYFKNAAQNMFAVDLSKEALENADNSVIPIYSDAEELPFIDEYFDVYLALRTLYSGHTKFTTCLSEAERVLKKGGKIILSIPNGYLVNKEIKKGMYDYRKKKIDEETPYKFCKKTINLLKKKKFSHINVKELRGEIVVSAIKT